VIAVMPQMRLLVAVEPVDFRRGIDGLAADVDGGFETIGDEAE